MSIIQERLALAIAKGACASAVEELTEKTDEEILKIIKEDFNYLSWLLEKSICTPQELFSYGLAKELKGEVEEINGGFWVCLTTATVGKVTGGRVVCRNGSNPTIGIVTGGRVTCWNGSNPNIGTVTGGRVDCLNGSNVLIHTAKPEAEIRLYDGAVVKIENDERRKSA